MKGNLKILLVGCGKMGFAMLTGWLAEGLKRENIRVIETDAKLRENIKKNYKIIAFPELSKLDSHFNPQVVLFAVKPQAMPQILPEYKKFMKGKLLVSIAAGKTVKSFEKIFGSTTAVVRTMPNLPATVGEGMTVFFANKKVTSSQKQQVSVIFSSVGEVLEIKNEKLIDSATAISGSGPAYLFLFLESLIESAKKLGFNDKHAIFLAKQTLKGSIKLALESSKSPENLRVDVTSKAGTTEAALKILMHDKTGIKANISKATSAAKKRSEELNS